MNWWNVADEGLGYGIFAVMGLVFSVHGWFIGRMSRKRAVPGCP